MGLDQREQVGAFLAGDQEAGAVLGSVEAHWQFDEPSGTLLRVVAGDGEAKLMLICGYF